MQETKPDLPLFDTEYVKELKTFSIHETNQTVASYFKKAVLKYKHLENMLNIILNKEISRIYSAGSVEKEENSSDKEKTEKTNPEKDFTYFNLLTSPMIMKAVLSGNEGGEKTKKDILKCKTWLINNETELYLNMTEVGAELNDKNISQIITRLKKDWSLSLKNLKLWYADKSKFTGKPGTPKPKKLSKVYNYSVPLEVSKFSLSRKDTLGINIFKKMKSVFLKDNPYMENKIINNVTVLLSHGHIYYKLSWVYKVKEKQVEIKEGKTEKKKDKTHFFLKNLFSVQQQKKSVMDAEKLKNINSFDKNNVLNRKSKTAGLDIGVHHLFSLFVNDKETPSLIYRNAKMIHYNCAFNKHMARLNTEISKHVAVWKEIDIKVNNTVNGEMVSSTAKRNIAESYTPYGQHLINKKSNMFNSRNLFFEGEMHKLSSALLKWLKKHGVSELVISKNLSFAKTEGSITLNKKTQQSFYQIPFGKFLNYIEEKAFNYGIKVIAIDESYTSKTSCLSADVNKIKQLALSGQPFTNELNGVRGRKKKVINGQFLGRGLFLDTLKNTTINADLNAAVNHIKVAFPESINIKQTAKRLFKLCNPIQLKSANEFDKLILKRSGLN